VIEGKEHPIKGKGGGKEKKGHPIQRREGGTRTNGVRGGGGEERLLEERRMGKKMGEEGRKRGRGMKKKEET